jgi:XTP/dITP diphosphohydrolase
MEIIFATHNQGKLKEIQSSVNQNINIISLDELKDFEEIEETGNTLEENALIKAQTIYNKYKKAVFADDTGLEIDALNLAPGVYSARYAGEPSNPEKNMDKVLEELQGEHNRSARFKTVIAYINDKGVAHFFEGLVEGTILEERQGTEGFGYDPIFQPQGYTTTFAQMSLAEKNTISHRGKAVRALIDYLNQENA